MIVSFSRIPHSVIVVLIIALAFFSLVLQIARYTKVKPADRTTEYKVLFALEFLTIVALLICCAMLIFVYSKYIPWDSPGYLSYVAPYGVIASNVDPSTFAASTTTYPAVTYALAVEAYKNSPNGFTTGLFAWDGLAVTILKAEATQLGTPGAPKGTSWVFQDLNTAVARAN